jgi:hypothetical protein
MTTKKLITIVLFAATAAFAQTAESRTPVTDAEKIADAEGYAETWCLFSGN